MGTEGWAQERKNGAEWVLGWIFSCTYSNEKTENARRPREARELSRHEERNREESPYGERTREKVRVSWLSPALSHMGAVFSFCEMVLCSLHHPPHFRASLNMFLVLAKVFD